MDYDLVIIQTTQVQYTTLLITFKLCIYSNGEKTAEVVKMYIF